MKKTILILTLIALCFSAVSCTAGPNQLKGVPDDEGQVAGFWEGLWHGLISPVTFIISLFSKTVYVYEVHNNGGWYNFGFLLGASITLGGSGGGAASSRKKRRD
ncbi:MAG: hypothetical protein R6U57_10485 [Anaerolineales bacterium]